MLPWMVHPGRFSRFVGILFDSIVENSAHVRSSAFGIAESCRIAAFCGSAALAASTTGESERHLSSIGFWLLLLLCLLHAIAILQLLQSI